MYDICYLKSVSIDVITQTRISSSVKELFVSCSFFFRFEKSAVFALFNVSLITRNRNDITTLALYGQL